MVSSKRKRGCCDDIRGRRRGFEGCARTGTDEQNKTERREEEEEKEDADTIMPIIVTAAAAIVAIIIAQGYT